MKKEDRKTEEDIANYITQAYEKIVTEYGVIAAVIISSIEHFGLDKYVFDALKKLGFDGSSDLRKMQILLDRRGPIDIAMDMAGPECKIYIYKEEYAPKEGEIIEDAFNIPKDSKFLLYKLKDGSLIEQDKFLKVIQDKAGFIQSQPKESENFYDIKIENEKQWLDNKVNKQ